MEPDSVQTNARGCALFRYDCDTGLLEYFVVHDVVSNTIGESLADVSHLSVSCNR